MLELILTSLGVTVCTTGNIAVLSAKGFNEPIWQACCSSSGCCTTSKTVAGVVLFVIRCTLQKMTHCMCKLLAV